MENCSSTRHGKILYVEVDVKPNIYKPTLDLTDGVRSDQNVCTNSRYPIVP